MKDKHQYSSLAGSRLVLVAAIASLVWNWTAQADNTQRSPLEFRDITRIDGFSVFNANRIVKPVSISGIEAAGVADLEKLEWVRRMMSSMEQMLKRPAGEDGERIDDILAFRSWCLGAEGKGNLLLSTAAAETALEMLFRDFASGVLSAEEAQKRLSRISPDVPPANYWLKSLALEEHPAAQEVSLVPDAPEYIRLAAIVNALWNDPDELEANPPEPDVLGWWGGQPDTTTFLELSLRLMVLARKTVALETCLAIQKATGTIPTKRMEFIDVAGKNAWNVLGKKSRMGGSMTESEVWDYWSQALSAAGKK